MITWGYIAGCIDCDGWVSNTEKTKQIGITQSEKYENEMYKISEFLNINRINHIFTKRVPHRTTVHWNYQMLNIVVKNQQTIVDLCNIIEDYILFKKDLIIKLRDDLIKIINNRNYMKSKFLEVCIKQDKRKYWKDEEISKLNELLNRGIDPILIAEELNRSYSSVKHKISRLDMQSRGLII